MIRYLKNTEIDKTKWDNCIRNSIQPSIFVYSWYLDIVCIKWGALVLNDYEAVFPLAFNTKWKIPYIYQPFFTRYFGFYSNKPYTSKLKQDFFDAIPSSFKYIKLCLNITTDESIPPSYTKQHRNYQILHLNNSYEELKKHFSDNTKRNIKRGIKAGLTIRHSIPPEAIVELFKKTKGDELNTFSKSDYKRLIRLMQECISRNNAETIAVYHAEQLCAAALFMYSDKQFVFLKSGVTEQGKSIGAMHFLMDSFISSHSEKDMILDFGGSSVESVARFYKGFGALDCVYLQLEKKPFLDLGKWAKKVKSLKPL